MKKLVGISLFTMISLIAFSFATPTISDNKPIEIKQTAKVKADEDALYCKVEKDGITVVCWFCDCEALADKINKN